MSDEEKQPTDQNGLDKLTEQEAENLAKNLVICGDIFFQLMNFPRYAMFVGANYDIQVNPETECVDITERPAEEAVQWVKDAIRARQDAKQH